MRRAGLALALALAFAAPAHAVLPDEQLKDPMLEARARALSAQLRCVVCQNQSIDDSDAALAHDLRVLLRERLQAGDTDDQAVGYIVARYGSYVLLKPPFDGRTLALWIAPGLFLLGGGAWVTRYLAERRGAPAALSEEERRRAADLLGKNDPA